jgi:hypothetical protein
MGCCNHVFRKPAVGACHYAPRPAGAYAARLLGARAWPAPRLASEALQRRELLRAAPGRDD